MSDRRLELSYESQAEDVTLQHRSTTTLPSKSLDPANLTPVLLELFRCPAEMNAPASVLQRVQSAQRSPRSSGKL